MTMIKASAIYHIALEPLTTMCPSLDVLNETITTLDDKYDTVQRIYPAL